MRQLLHYYEQNFSSMIQACDNEDIEYIVLSIVIESLRTVVFKIIAAKVHQPQLRYVLYTVWQGLWA